MAVIMGKFKDCDDRFMVVNDDINQLFISGQDECLDCMNLWSKGEDVYGRIDGILVYSSSNKIGNYINATNEYEYGSEEDRV